MQVTNLTKITYTLLFYLFVLVKPTHAYLDPGSGSYFIQILIGSLISLSFFTKSFWKKITEFITKIKEKQSNRKSE